MYVIYEVHITYVLQRQMDTIIQCKYKASMKDSVQLYEINK